MTTEERKAEDARFRQEYPLFAQYPELIYLDNAATTQKPSCVIQAESAFYEKYNAWKNHAMHGNCIKLCHSMDLYVKEVLKHEQI